MVQTQAYENLTQVTVERFNPANPQMVGTDVQIVEILMRFKVAPALRLLTSRLETAPGDVLKRILSAKKVLAQGRASEMVKTLARTRHSHSLCIAKVVKVTLDAGEVHGC